MLSDDVQIAVHIAEQFTAVKLIGKPYLHCIVIQVFSPAF
jgi:hypothetical protein